MKSVSHHTLPVPAFDAVVTASPVRDVLRVPVLRHVPPGWLRCGGGRTISDKVNTRILGDLGGQPCANMRALDVTDTLDLALETLGCDNASRLQQLSDRAYFMSVR